MNDKNLKSENGHGFDKVWCASAENLETKMKERPPSNSNRFLGICIIIAAAIVGGTILYTSRFEITGKGTFSTKVLADLEKAVMPAQGITLPVRWGDLGKGLIDSGAIDRQKFEDLYKTKGGLDEVTKKLLSGTDNGQLIITQNNANTLLNLFWALGLANENRILTIGPMTDKQYGGDPGRFASTGGWTLAIGSAMEHYGRHAMIRLTPEQQTLVERVSRNIYRPCCGNSTYFPDCNHGMAMLGLLELMASQDVSEADMYKAALAVNSFWFPDNYLNVAKFLKSRGIAWEKTDPKQLLSANFSSANGYRQILQQITPQKQNGGGSCGL